MLRVSAWKAATWRLLLSSGMGAAAALPATALAQSAPPATCDGGRIAHDLTVYRCCWPGQVWNDEHRRCSGPPLCPAPMEAHGDECVAARSSGNQAGSGGVRTMPMTSDEAVAELAPARRGPGRRPNYGFVGAGSILFGSMFLPGAALGIFGAAGGSASTLLLELPVFGAFVGGVALLGASGSGWFCGGGLCAAAGTIFVLDAVLQGVGLGLLFSGLSLREATPAGPGAASRHVTQLHWAISPGAAAAPIGVSFTMVNF